MPDEIPPLDDLLTFEGYIRDGCHQGGALIDADPGVDHDVLDAWQAGGATEPLVAALVAELDGQPNLVALLRQLLQSVGIGAATTVALADEVREP